MGARVYWPGSGLEIVEFDLLDVGDDVVFGSRSVIITSSSTASRRVTFEAGCMIADRCVVLPGRHTTYTTSVQCRPCVECSPLFFTLAF